MSRNLSIDLLKILMALMVVALHAGFLKETNSTASYLVSNSLFRMAVPIFLLINGYYFHLVISGNSLMSWCKRILLLYVFWMLVYSYFWLSDAELSPFGLAMQIKDIVIGYHHLWYLPAMLGAGVILYACRHYSSQTLVMLVAGLYAMGVLIQYAGNYHLLASGFGDKLLNTYWIYRNFIFFGFPFFTLGYLLRTTDFIDAIPQGRLTLLLGVAWLVLLLEVIANYYLLPKAEGFDMFASLLFLCPLAFAWANRSNLPDTRNIAKALALYSAAIYFVHPLFISWFGHYMPLGSLMTLYVALASVVAAFFVIRLNKRLGFIL